LCGWDLGKGEQSKYAGEKKRKYRQGKMSAGVDEGARRSGAKLVMEVEVEGLSSVGSDIRFRYGGLLT
jgi:hypothetical protein